MEAAADLIFAEGWQFFWLAWVVAATLAAIRVCSPQTVIVALTLLAGWVLTNVFWQIPLTYMVADAVFFTVTLGLWVQSREGHLLTVAMVYLPMLATNLAGPGFPFQMVVLNVLFGVQLSVVTRDAWRRWKALS